jgi:hypothetical protein
MRNYRAYTLYFNDEAELSKVTESESFGQDGAFFRLDVLTEITDWALKEHHKAHIRWLVEYQAEQIVQRGETAP